ARVISQIAGKIAATNFTFESFVPPYAVFFTELARKAVTRCRRQGNGGEVKQIGHVVAGDIQGSVNTGELNGITKISVDNHFGLAHDQPQPERIIASRIAQGFQRFAGGFQLKFLILNTAGAGNGKIALRFSVIAFTAFADNRIQVKVQRQTFDGVAVDDLALA